MKSLITLLTPFFFTSLLLAEEQLIKRNLPYTEPADEQRRLDVYAPQDVQDAPVIVWIHGGAWRVGDKASVQQKPKAFNAKGFVFVSINYRFIPKVNLKQQVADVAKAVGWVSEHAKVYGGSKEKIIVMGHSAGAHLAALVCTHPELLKAEDVSSKQIIGCVPVDTATYDVPSLMKIITPRRKPLYTGVFGKTETEQAKGSPVTYVKADADIPPFLVIHVASRKDSSAQSAAFVKKLQSVNISAKIHAAQNKTHATVNRELGIENDEPTKAVFEFLDEILKSSNEKKSPAK